MEICHKGSKWLGHRFKANTPYERYVGSLLTKKHIVTAAHIFKPFEENELNKPDAYVNGEVHAGAFDKTHVGQASSVQSRKINKDNILIHQRM